MSEVTTSLRTYQHVYVSNSYFIQKILRCGHAACVVVYSFHLSVENFLSKKCFLFIYQWDIYTKDSQLLVICESQIWKDMFWRFKVTAGEPELGLKPPVEKYKWRKVPNSSQHFFLNCMHLSYVRLKFFFSTINTKIINYVLPFNIIYYFIIIFLNILIKLFLHQPPPCRRLTM